MLQLCLSGAPCWEIETAVHQRRIIKMAIGCHKEGTSYSAVVLPDCQRIRKSHRPLTPIILKSIAIHLPLVSRYFANICPFLGRKIVYTTSAHRNRSDFCDLRLRCPSRTPEIVAISETRESNAALRFKGAMEIASDLRFGVAISKPKTHCFCRKSGDLTPSTRKSPAIAMVRFWCAKIYTDMHHDTAPIRIAMSLLQKY